MKNLFQKVFLKQGKNKDVGFIIIIFVYKLAPHFEVIVFF